MVYRQLHFLGKCVMIKTILERLEWVHLEGIYEHSGNRKFKSDTGSQ